MYVHECGLTHIPMGIPCMYVSHTWCPHSTTNIKLTLSSLATGCTASPRPPILRGGPRVLVVDWLNFEICQSRSGLDGLAHHTFKDTPHQSHAFFALSLLSASFTSTIHHILNPHSTTYNLHSLIHSYTTGKLCNFIPCSYSVSWCY